MFKKVALIFALVVGSFVMAAPQEAHATGGLFARIAQNRAAVRNARIQRARQQAVVNKVVVNHGFNRVVVDAHGRALVQRNVVIQNQRNLRIVEVPNLQVQRNLVIVRDRHGRVVDVRSQNVVDVQKFQSRRGAQKIIVEQNVIRGY